VLAVQRCLNNIANYYPSIPKITEDSVYGEGTRNAVREFQNVFGILSDGIVGPSTWSRIGQVCAESGGSSPNAMPPYPGNVIRRGAVGTDVRQIQRCINNVASRYPSIPRITEDRVYGGNTVNAVTAFQRQFGLSADGAVGPVTWARLMQECRSSDTPRPNFPGYSISFGDAGNFVTQIQQCLNNISDNYPSVPKLTADGKFGAATRNAVIAFQRQFGLDADGIVGRLTWEQIMSHCNETLSVPVAVVRSGGCLAEESPLQITSAELLNGSGTQGIMKMMMMTMLLRRQEPISI
jgi:peptidoglycan hydrolase-like protein with peptidoglycan-binding domain